MAGAQDAYLARQPFFREYPRLLIYETGVHFIDTFRFLLGEVATVVAETKRLNPAIRGEDAGQVLLEVPERVDGDLGCQPLQRIRSRQPAVHIRRAADRRHSRSSDDGH